MKTRRWRHRSVAVRQSRSCAAAQGGKPARPPNGEQPPDVTYLARMLDAEVDPPMPQDGVPMFVRATHDTFSFGSLPIGGNPLPLSHPDAPMRIPDGEMEQQGGGATTTTSSSSTSGDTSSSGGDDDPGSSTASSEL